MGVFQLRSLTHSLVQVSFVTGAHGNFWALSLEQVCQMQPANKAEYKLRAPQAKSVKEVCKFTIDASLSQEKGPDFQASANQWLTKNNSKSFQGHPQSIFGKYLFGRRFEIQNFRSICCKISCLPASPRILEHLKNGKIAHF